MSERENGTRPGKHGIPIGVHVALAAGVLAIAYPLGDGWLAMLDSYVRAFFGSTAFSFIC